MTTEKNNIEIVKRHNIIKVHPEKMFMGLLIIILFLLAANFVGILLTYYFHHDHCHGLVPLFDFDVEKNIPTFYSSFALFFASVLLGVIALLHKKAGERYLLWGGLMFIFLFLTLDEFVSIHEHFEGLTRNLIINSGLFNISRIMFYAWVIPYGIALIVFVAAYWKFLFNLPRRIMILFIVSGIIFVSGAIGVETIGGIYHKLHGDKNIVYSLLYTLEETLEMLGIAVFIYTLLLYISEKFKTFSLTFINSGPDSDNN